MMVKSTTWPALTINGPVLTDEENSSAAMSSKGPLATNDLGITKSRVVVGMTFPALQVAPDPTAEIVTGDPKSFFT
jgi:hypothetical protein